MHDLRRLLARTADIAADFYESLDARPVFPRATLDDLRAALGGPLPAQSTDADTVISDLAAAADPGLVATAGGGTMWEDRRAIRLSVSNWQTSDADLDRVLAAFRAAVIAETA